MADASMPTMDSGRAAVVRCDGLGNSDLHSDWSTAVRHSVPDWMVSIFRSAFPELAAMSDDELARRVAAVEAERDTVGHLVHIQARGRAREPFREVEEFPF